MNSTIAALTDALAATDTALSSFSRYRNGLPPDSPACHGITTAISIVRDGQEQLTAARHIAEENRNLADIIDEEEETDMTLPAFLDRTIETAINHLDWLSTGPVAPATDAESIRTACQIAAAGIFEDVNAEVVIELAYNTLFLATRQPPASAFCETPLDGIKANAQEVCWQQAANHLIDKANA